jgi:hypothetical protein
MAINPEVPNSTLEEAFRRLREVVEDGLRHGFFDFTVTGEIVGQKKRRLTIRAGKSYLYVIPEEDLGRH